MSRNALDYSATPKPTPRRAIDRAVGVLAAILCAGTLAMWVRSESTGDYVYLGRFYLSFARGNCRVVYGPWPFVAGKPFVTYPLDKVGEYFMGSGASYVPLWLLALVFIAIAGWCVKRSLANDNPPRRDGFRP